MLAKKLLNVQIRASKCSGVLDSKCRRDCAFCDTNSNTVFLNFNLIMDKE